MTGHQTPAAGTPLTALDRLLIGLIVVAVILTLGVTYMSSQVLLSALPSGDPRQVLGGVEGAVLLACFALSCAVSLQIWTPILPQWDVILATALVLALPSTSVGLIQDPAAVWLICAVLLGLSGVRLLYLTVNRPDLPFRVLWASGAIGAAVALSLAALAFWVPQAVLPAHFTLLHVGGIGLITIAIFVFVTRSRTYHLVITGALLGAGVFCLVLPGMHTLDWRAGMGWFDPGQRLFLIFSVFCMLIALPAFLAFIGLIRDLVLLQSDPYDDAGPASSDMYSLIGFGSALLVCAVLLIALGKMPFLTLGIAVLCAMLYLPMAFCYDLFAADIRNANYPPKDEDSPHDRVFQQAIWPFHIGFAVSGIAVTVALGVWFFSTWSTVALVSLGLGALVLVVFAGLSIAFSAQTVLFYRDGRALRRFWSLALVALFLYTSGAGIGVIAPRMIAQMVPNTQIAASIDTLRNCGDVYVRFDRADMDLQFEKLAALLGAFDSQTTSVVHAGLTAQGPTLGTIDYRTPLWLPKRAVLSVRPVELAPLCQRWLGPHLGR